MMGHKRATHHTVRRSSRELQLAVRRVSHEDWFFARLFGLVGTLTTKKEFNNNTNAPSPPRALKEEFCCRPSVTRPGLVGWGWLVGWLMIMCDMIP